VRNGGSNQITNCATVLNVAGQQYNENYSFSLSPGSTTTLTTSIPLPSSGEYQGTFTITTVNGGTDGYTNDNESCIAISVIGNSFPFGENFNSCGVPSGMTFSSTNQDNININTTGTNGLNACIGCFMIYVGYNQQPQTATACLPTTDVSGLNGAELVFSYGHIPRYNFISNNLSVVFTNCDGSEDILWSASGLNLGTNSPQAYVDPGGGGPIPTCDEISTITVPIPPENTEGEICFRLSGRFYSVILIDEFEIRQSQFLPLNVTSLTAQAVDKHNRVDWSTSFEENLQAFVIERSIDEGINFTPINEIPADNYTVGSRYEFLDHDPVINNQAQVYYRVRARDFDGTENLFGPVTVNREVLTDNWTVSPNPISAGNQLQVMGQAANATLYDLTGRALFSWQTQTTGNASIAESLPAGLYLLRLTALKGEASQTKRLIIK